MGTNPVAVMVWLAVILTVIGTFRLTTYFFRRDPLYAVVTAVTVSFLFVTLFEAIVTAVGIVALAAPVWVGLRRHGDRLLAALPNAPDGGLIDEDGILPDGGGAGPAQQPAEHGQQEGGLAMCPACNRVFRGPQDGCPHCGAALVNDIGGDR